MLPAWVMGFADGSEHGSYLALDLGGTNLRVCLVTLEQLGNNFDMIQSKYKLVRFCDRYFANRVACRIAKGDRRTAIWICRRMSR